MTNKKIDPRVKRTNQYLINAIVKLLNDKDINKISIQNITDSADLTRATFYLHYRDKQDFFNRIVTNVIDDLIDYVKDGHLIASGLNNESDIKNAFTRLFEYIYMNYEFFSVMLSDRGLSQFRPKLESVVQKEIYIPLFHALVKIDGEKTSKFPQHYFLNYITSAHIGVICTWLNDDMNYSPKHMAELLYKLTLEGIFSVVRSEF
ncbi:TetR/AcrR family transcriptional regulator [Staphylococcus aureus]|uniref:TetR/AcrR family transcriptional regulator n=1 Tax=Staphylococcus aureus TaxID=1280 RepID=UPI000DE2CBAF|nr:TetR-like C-terminal domain-containing protein [Staphylococcus aureus]